MALVDERRITARSASRLTGSRRWYALERATIEQHPQRRDLGQFVLLVNSASALAHRSRYRAPWIKIVLHRQLADLGVELLYLLLVVLGLDRVAAEHILGAFDHSASSSPGSDWGERIKLLGQLAATVRSALQRGPAPPSP